MRVSGQWSVVSGQWSTDCRASFGSGLCARPANRFEIVVQFRSKLVDQRLKRVHIMPLQQPATVRPPQKMLGFIKRSPRSAHKSPIIGVAASAFTLRNVRSHTICSTHQLHPNRVPRERIPLQNKVPNMICNFLRQSINPEILKIGFHLGNPVNVAPSKQLTTDY